MSRKLRSATALQATLQDRCPAALARAETAAERFSWRTIAGQYRDFFKATFDRHREQQS